MSTADQLELPKPKRDASEGELDITPMIDITFLLLAFFVVVSRMDPQAAVILPKATYPEMVSEKSSVILIIAERDGDPVIFKGRTMDDQSIVAKQEPSMMEAEIGEYVEREFSSNPSKETVLVKAEGEITTRTVELVKRGVSLSELAESKNLYVAVQEAK